MPKAPSLTWAGGVISPGLYGRVDLNKYQTGLKTAENFTISVEGGAEKRFGTYLIGSRRDVNLTSRLIPWRISNDDSYILEFGNEYIRFIRFGGYVSIPSDHVALPGNEAANNTTTGLMEIGTPYLSSELRQLKVTFANDQMFINHPSHAENVLSRIGLYDWKIEAQDFEPHPAGPTGQNSAWHNDLVDDDNYIPDPVATSYCISATLSDGTETLPSAITTVNADTGHQRLYVTISWDSVTDATQYTVYKGANGIFGFIGYTTNLEYEDRNIAPSYDVVPLGNNVATAGNASVSEFYKQRKVYAAPAAAPQDIYISRPSVFTSLKKSVPSQADDAIKATLVGRNRHTINWMIELKKFLIFTDSAEWILGTTNNEALSPSSINPTIETQYGSNAFLRPIPIGDRILFVQGITDLILDMGYEFTADAFKADELSRLARHLFKNKSIVAWDYAKYPGNLLPTVVSDGTVNVMTYAREHEIWGWSSMITDGVVLDVACVEEINETGIYFQVKRTINGVDNYFIERMSFPSDDRIDHMVYTDCSLTYKDPLGFTNLVRVDDYTVTFQALDNSYLIGDELQLEDYFSNIYRAEITAVTDDAVTVKPVRTTYFPEGLGATGTAYRCVTNVSGLDHLEGKEVWVLADGKVVKDILVTSGEINLDFTAAYITVGLPYYATLETLGLDIQVAAGQYTIKTIDEIIINLRQSRGVYVSAIGSPKDAVMIEPRNQENMYDANDQLDGPYEVPSHVNWDLTAAVRVQSFDPLPLNILNIIPDIVYGN